MTAPFPLAGRVAGIDYGHLRIGIALSDPGRTLASPLATYQRVHPDADADYFRQLTQTEQIVGFVVGLPIHASGAESQKSSEARRFGKWLGEVTQRPVCFFDERYSTAGAERLLQAAGLTSKRRRKRRDMLAAQIILASFLEAGPDAGESTLPLE